MSDVLHDVPVTHTRLNPVYVLGYPRSGTSLTCQLLRRYLKVSFGTESQFVVRYHRQLSRYGDLNDNANLRRLFKDICAERFFARSQRNWGFVFDPARALADVHERTYSAVLHAIFQQLAEHNGMVRWGDKTPQYNEDLLVLRRLFPDAQFVHVVRDGRDVALSLRQIHFGPKNACDTAGQWVRALRAIRSFAGELPADQFFEIRYEDLTDRPVDTLDALAGFLGIDDRAGALRAYIRDHIGNDIRTDNSRKWRQRLRRREIERFEAIAAAELDHFGYELVFGDRARPVSALERFCWILHSHASRLLMAGSWSDNWYKLGLRLRTLNPYVMHRPAVSGRIVLERKERV